MKTREEVATELGDVRALLAQAREDADGDVMMLYGAQQALSWVLGTGMAPAAVARIVAAAAAAGMEVADG